MKRFAILVLLGLTFSCASFNNQNRTSILASDSNANQGNIYSDLFKQNKLKEIEKQRNELKDYIAGMSKTEQLSVLKEAKFAGKDLEIRIRKQSAWWKTWLFILKRVDDKWSAEYQKQSFYDGTEKIKSVSKKKLDEPKSSWENVWKKITDEHLLNLADGLENNGNDPCPDCGNYLIETKTAENYKIYVYTNPSSQSELYEARQISKISNIIAEEFQLNEFNTETSIE